MPEWLQKYQNKQITDAELLHAIRSYCNVVNEIEIELEAIKPARTLFSPQMII